MPLARFLLAAAAIALACLATAPAQACSVRTTSVAFGNYNSISSAPLTGTGSIIIDCEDNNDLFASVAVGAGSSGNYAQRQMRNGTARLNYNLYTATGTSSIWGNGSSGTSTVTVWGFLRTTRTIYGIIPAGQQVRSGAYTDTLVVTVTF